VAAFSLRGFVDTAEFFSGQKKGEALADFSLFQKRLRSYFFFLTAFLAFLAGAFFLAVAMENHPLFRSH
jgi:hypothetical protein